jgi:hypothetical protein
MEELEVKLGKEKALSGLSAVEFLGGLEVRQVLVIRKDHSGKRGTMEIVAPGLQSLNYAEQFAIVDFIVPLGRIRRMRDVTTGMPVTIGVLLAENTACGPFGGICFNHKWFLVVRHQENWGFLKLCFQVFLLNHLEDMQEMHSVQ